MALIMNDAYERTADARERGRQHRKDVPRRRLGEFQQSARDGVDILIEQNSSRLPDLVPLRFARMLTDPFGFYRGTAALMAADLAASPSSGLDVISCGDAHLSNFGVYASPERELVFDLNDFDEASTAPWEWDVKRLITSVVIGARQAGHDQQAVRGAAREAADRYVDGLGVVMGLSVIERHYLHAQPELVADRLPVGMQQVIERTAQRARRRTSRRAAKRLTELDADGQPRFLDDPPVLTHVSDQVIQQVRAAYQEYLHSVEPDIALLLRHFRICDIARRVVGVGSVGTRCFLVLLKGPSDEPLVLQIKQAQTSVLQNYGRQHSPKTTSWVLSELGEGARVVALQKMLQATSDPFLGYLRAVDQHYYVRQFHDMKGSIEVEGMDRETFTSYAGSCATLLARAHAQSPNAAAVLGYIGSGDRVN
ncbi:MAG TPA: DUF2252 domain-containing protein, partial [Microlunatus sp.]